MTAGGRRGRRRKPGWGDTFPHLPPSPPPEGIDLVIEKLRIDDPIIRQNRQLQAEAREARSSFDELYDEVVESIQADHDPRGRVEVDLRDALVGAAAVAVIAAIGYWILTTALAGSALAP